MIKILFVITVLTTGGVATLRDTSITGVTNKYVSSLDSSCWTITTTIDTVKDGFIQWNQNVAIDTITDSIIKPECEWQIIWQMPGWQSWHFEQVDSACCYEIIARYDPHGILPDSTLIPTDTLQTTGTDFYQVFDLTTGLYVQKLQRIKNRRHNTYREPIGL